MADFDILARTLPYLSHAGIHYLVPNGALLSTVLIRELKRADLNALFISLELRRFIPDLAVMMCFGHRLGCTRLNFYRSP